MRVLFTHSYFMRFDPKQVAHAQPYAPLGTLVAAACARQKGHQVKLHDTMFAQHPEEIIPLLDEYVPDVLVIYDDGFNYLTKMCLSNMRDAALTMQKLAKARGCRVIVSSSDSADHFQKYLDGGADYVIIGEGENTLTELLGSLERSEAVDRIHGLAFAGSGAVVKTPPRQVARNLDEYPVAAWDLVDFSPYRDMWMKRHGYFSVNIATTRGCPYKCNWCAKPIYGNAYHMRSARNVIGEIKMLKRLASFDHIWFCDDIFGLKRSWVSEFAELVGKENLHLRFKIQSRADLLVQERYVEDLAAAGCDDVWMGAESGSQQILDAMDKGTTVGQIRQARSLLKKHGIKASFFLQFGYPGERESDIKKTIALVKDTMPDDIGISVSYPLPGTVFYERVKSEMGNKTNWTDSDELALMFRNTYAPGFYKTLHRLVHSVYRRQKAKNVLVGGASVKQRARALGALIKYTLKSSIQWTMLQTAK